MQPTYSPQEVQGILQWAITRHAQKGESPDLLTQAQLQEIAQELGISPEELAIAEQEWRQAQSLQRQRQEFQRWRWQQWRAQLQQTGVTIIWVTLPFLLLDWLWDGRVVVWTTRGLAWPYYLPALVTITSVISVGWRWQQVMQQSGETYEREWQAWQRQQRLQQIKQKAVRKLTSVLDWLERWLGD
ncbi:MAG: hypothetical protein NZL92_03665 [Gloeomargarita sp. SKYG116]|nr:hypothetical protein [Gloeomargarita sp. SKYG116]MCS7225515.1 hypothetical protein [Gloeomargarita sp. SKYB31]MDW8400780.1 hypothetical protein [Gloeomargarita sp. SKYGB_i_bin116]